MNRRAFTFIEMLVILPMIAVAGLLFALLLPATTRHVPRLAQAASYHRSIQNFVARLQDDVDAASDLPAKIGSVTADSQTLLLHTTDGAIAYKVSDGKVIREKLNGPAADKTYEWVLPEAKVDFQRWTRDDTRKSAYAVDVHTLLTVQRDGNVRESFENHHVLFLHVLRGDTKAKS
jgi:type II secretory pathway pseudopilin PulG